MRLWIMSDLHLEFAPMEVPTRLPNADICILAGDITNRGVAPSIQWAAEKISPYMPVVFVAGNHEYYRASYVEGRRDGLTRAANFPNLHFLDNNHLELGGIILAGSTLWTDFALLGHRDFSMREAATKMNDYRAIKYSKQPYRKFTPSITARLNMNSSEYLATVFDEARDKPVIVVTHHAPSMRSLKTEFQNDPLAPAYASNLDADISTWSPSLWIHGHTHTAVDYHIGNTRVISNPRGYPDEPAFKAFNPNLVIEV
jgi:Icc-related predicted phosphoesterase